MNEDRENDIAPSHRDAGVSTAPTPTAEDEVTELRAEVERLRALLDQSDQSEESGEGEPDGEYPAEINYGEAKRSGARLLGITEHRGKIRRSSDFPHLPKATTNQAQLERDFMRWGYCIVEDVLSPAQVEAQVNRLLDQAKAERAAKVAHMSHHGNAQLVFNMLPKGQVFRDLIAFEESACQRASLIETLLGKILGKGYYLGTTHGSIVHQGGGLQELHQDQGGTPLPHPEYPLACLIIWTFSEFSLEEGGTYMVPGSHREANGRNKIRPGVEFEKLAEGNLVSLTAPAGCCILTDSRLLHSGGERTARGTRLGMRNLYLRGMMRQQENQYLSVPENILAAVSPKLKALMGYKTFAGFGMVDGNVIDPDRPKVPVAELSMSRPEEFEQDFDWKYTQNARQLAGANWETFAEYLGPE
ncbi:MAG: phytanoyl-CoA dioxygenase family protein [bacterium]